MKNTKDFYAGLLFALLGGAFAWGAIDYQVGTSARMGPGYFPLLLGVLLALLGGILMLRAVLATDKGEAMGSWAWKPLVAIISANLLFGVSLAGVPVLHLPPLGLMVGIYALTLVSCLAGEQFILKDALLLATALAVLSYGAFVLLLKLQLPVWPVLGA